MSKPTIIVNKYCSSFSIWAKVCHEKGMFRDEDVTIILNGCDHLYSKFSGEVLIETLCTELELWANRTATARMPLTNALKSCLLLRLIYGGEELRTVKCPIHKGEWSGCSPDPCPAGCSFGSNITGWLPNNSASVENDKHDKSK